MSPAPLVMSFFPLLAAEVVVLPLDSPARDVAVLAGDEQGVAVLAADNSVSSYWQDMVVIFSGKAIRTGGEPDATIELPHHGARNNNILILEDGTLAADSQGFVDIYDPQAVMSGAAAPVLSLQAENLDSRVMTQLSGGRLLAGRSIFAKDAVTQGGNPSMTLDLMEPYGQWDAVKPFQGGAIYTTSNGLLLFDDAAIASGSSSLPGTQAALLWTPHNSVYPCPKWIIEADFCGGPSHVFADGAIAVFGSCDYWSGESASMLLLENINLEAHTLKNQSFAMMKGKPEVVLALPSGLVAVGVTTLPLHGDCEEGHVEIFEESVLRNGGDPALVVNTSGAVNSMAVFGDGRLAVATEVGCNSGTVDIIDVAAEMRQSSPVSV